MIKRAVGYVAVLPAMKYSRLPYPVMCLTIALILCCMSTASLALIITSWGNDPVENMGWPVGAERVANLSSRLGYWEGPPFGGGEYHFLYRCKDTSEFNEAVKVFAEIRTPELELVVHDGPGHSYVFDDKQVDWTFTVWKPENWHRLFSDPKGVFFSDQSNFRKPVPPPTIDVYIGGGGSIVWEEVEIPPNVRVVDKRAASAPVKPEGGGLVCGEVYDMATGQTIAGAAVSLAKRGRLNRWREVIHANADDVGLFSIDKIPAGRYEIRIRANGYASRKHGSYDNKDNTYHEFIAELMREASIKGIVTDADDKPIPGVVVTARGTLAIDGLGYPCVDAEPATTDKEGRFEISGLPEGFTLLTCRKPSLHQATSMFELYEVHGRSDDRQDDIKIVMTGTGTVRVKVTGSDGKRPSEEVHVSIQPPGGPRRGQWGGSGTCKEDGTCKFKEVPPGEYLVSTNPMFMIEGKDPDAKSVTVKVGDVVDVTVTEYSRGD
jgi:hypothetical protein